MKVECHPSCTVADAVPYWIKKTDFLKYFCQHDAQFRLPTVLVHAYLVEWFRCYDTLTFTMPGIHFVDGKTEFFNGRHRTALLFKFLDELPFSFETNSSNDERLLSVIPKRPLLPTDRLFVPDLPIWKNMPSDSTRKNAYMLSRWSKEPEIRKIVDPPPDYSTLPTVTVNFGWVNSAPRLP